MAGNKSAVFADPAQDGLENPQALTNPHTPLFSGPLHLGLRGKGGIGSRNVHWLRFAHRTGNHREWNRDLPVP
jgi:hypothetical protein